MEENKEASSPQNRSAGPRFYCRPGRGERWFEASTWSEVVAGIIGPDYLEANSVQADVYREDYCLAKLVLFPDNVLDPRTEEAFCRSLAEAGLIELYERPDAADQSL